MISDKLLAGWIPFLTTGASFFSIHKLTTKGRHISSALWCLYS